MAWLCRMKLTRSRERASLGRLTDSRLTDDGNHLPVTGPRLILGPSERIKLGITPDKLVKPAGCRRL